MVAGAGCILGCDWHQSNSVSLPPVQYFWWRQGSGTSPWYYTMARKCRRAMASWKGLVLVNSVFLGKQFHLILLTFTTVVPGSYSGHTNVSIALSVSVVSSSEVPRAANANTTLSGHLLSIYQQVNFPLLANLPVWSAPVKALKPIIAAVFVTPSICTIGARVIFRFLFHIPVMKYVSLHG